MGLLNILDKLFYKKYVENRVHFCFFGLKFKFKQSSEKRISRLEREVKLLRALLDNCIDITKIPPTSVGSGARRCVQLIKTKLLELSGICLERANIPYWVDYGTLIGAIRHKGFIPWDDDVDVSVLRDDYLKTMDVLKQVASKYPNLRVDFDNIGLDAPKIYYKEFCIDFFCFEYLNKKCTTQDEIADFKRKYLNARKKLLKKYPVKSKKKNLDHMQILADSDRFVDQEFKTKYIQDRTCGQLTRTNDSVPRKKCSIVEEKAIFPLKRAQFEGITVPIPNDSVKHLYLTEDYGEYGAVMNFPSAYDCGFSHMLDKYTNKPLEYYQNILSEISQIVENEKNILQNK